MKDANPVKTPLTPGIKLSLQDSPDEVDPELQRKYQEIIGSLMYLYQWTRPDLGYAVTFLSRYLHKPGVAHMNAAKRVLIYLRGTTELGLRYTRDAKVLEQKLQKQNTLYAMADSDFAGCLDTGKSTTGYMIFMNGAVVAYYSARQSTVALCTAMAETIALTKLVVKVKHMRALMAGLTHHQEGETVINSTCAWTNNTATLSVMKGYNFT